jgi:hypothetical protein
MCWRLPNLAHRVWRPTEGFGSLRPTPRRWTAHSVAGPCPPTRLYTCGHRGWLARARQTVFIRCPLLNGLRSSRHISLDRLDCWALGRAAAHCPVTLNLDLLGNFECIIDLDAEVTNGATSPAGQSSSGAPLRDPARSHSAPRPQREQRRPHSRAACCRSPGRGSPQTQRGS